MADSYVTEIDSNTNFGNNAALRTDGTPLIYSYLRFNVPTLSGGVTSASLRVFAETTSNLGFVVRGTSGGWSESTITYTNAPAFGGVIGSSGSGSAGTWLTVNVTALVTGPGEVNLVMTTSDPTAVRYSSRQGTNPPQLVISVGSTLQSMSIIQSQPITVVQPTYTPLPTATATATYTPPPTPSSTPSPQPTLTATYTATPEVIAPEETPIVMP